MRDWMEVNVSVTQDSEEAMASALFDLGSKGVIQKEEPGAATLGTLTGYLENDPSLPEKLDALLVLWEELCQLGLAEGVCNLTTKPIPESDWATSWQKWFKPLAVSKRITVTPIWDPVEAGPDQIVIRINPGMAFGTGEHETTKLCLCALEQEIRPGDRVLDVGTGSAILGIAAAQLGASSVLGLDNDPVTFDNAQENILANAVADRVQVYTGDIESPAVTGQYRVLVSNIDVRTLTRLLPQLLKRLDPEGVLILSGILISESGAVTTALELQAVAIKTVNTLGEWWSCVASVK